MRFALTEEQEELARTVRTLLAKRSDSGAVRAAVERRARRASGLRQRLAADVNDS